MPHSFSMRRGLGAAISMACLLFLQSAGPHVAAADAEPFADLGDTFTGEVQPLLEHYCLDCHAADIKEGELDLERFGH